MPHRLLAPAFLLALGLAAPALAAPVSWSNLPDWSGQWVAVPGPRTAPPYNRAWAAKQRQAEAAVKAGKLRDPTRTCGLPVGNPWMLSVSDIHEWILRPEEVWHSVENGGIASRIFVGQPHPPAHDLFPTYTGDSTGRWDGDTLVIDTIALRDDTWLGPGVLIHSDKTHLVERVRKTAPNRLEVQLTVYDPVAFTRPWRVVQTYRRLPPGGFVRDYACKVVRDGNG
jgi:hypothetical protein